MNDPIRLSDDPNASEYCRQLLKVGRSAPPGFAYDVGHGLERLRGALRERTAPASRSDRLPRFSLRIGAYALVSGFAVIAFGGSAAWIHHQRAVRATASNVRLVQSSAPTAAPPVARPKHPAADEIVPPPSPTSSPPVQRGVIALAKSSSPPADRGDDLSSETTDIAQLRSVARTDPHRALSMAQEGARRYPRGFFSQEREAIAITCLVTLGHVSEARTRAERFLAAHPRGPAAESIRESVGLSPP